MHQIVEVIATALDHEWEIVCMPDAIAHPARYYAERTSHHQLMDLAKIKRQLGYRDVHPAEEALRMTVEWLVANPPADGSSVSGDPFDYAAEDKLVAAYRESLASVAAVPFNIPEEMAHPYAHPKEASTTGDHRER